MPQLLDTLEVFWGGLCVFIHEATVEVFIHSLKLSKRYMLIIGKQIFFVAEVKRHGF